MNDTSKTAFSHRDAVEGVNPLFIERWSPRAFKPGEIDQATLSRLFDAARWSPSCFNEQPWCFYTSTADTFHDFLDLLQEGNQVWAKQASVIGFLTGKKHFAHNNKLNDCSALDCGAAWMAMTLQARLEGLYTHGMAGIHHARAAEYLGLDPTEQQVLMGFVIGWHGDTNRLPEALRERETPSPRKPLAEVWQQPG